jgi:hypothetical protein
VNLNNQTFLLLLSEFEVIHVPAEQVAKKYLGLGKRECYDQANQAKLPFPTFRTTESRKSPLLCDLRDVAGWLDQVRHSHKSGWKKINTGC